MMRGSKHLAQRFDMERVNPSADLGVFSLKPEVQGSTAPLGESSNSARPIARWQLGRAPFSIDSQPQK